MPKLISHLMIALRTRGRIHAQYSIRGMYLRQILKNRSDVSLRIFVPEDEEEEYIVTYPWAEKLTICVPSDSKSGDVFQAVLEYPGRYKFVIDDDLVLQRRRDPISSSQKGGMGTAKDAMCLVDRVKYWLEKGYAAGGISLRNVNHYLSGESYKENTRICGATFFDSSILMREGIRFDDVQARSDFHVYLSLLELGYLNVCDYEFIIGQDGMRTNSPGGCSIYRTPAFLAEQAEELRRLHPRSVTLRHKKSTNPASVGIMTEEGVPDVRIAWARSFGIRKHERRSTSLIRR
jgi:hypothetical protein